MSPTRNSAFKIIPGVGSSIYPPRTGPLKVPMASPKKINPQRKELAARKTQMSFENPKRHIRMVIVTSETATLRINMMLVVTDVPNKNALKIKHGSMDFLI